MHPAAVSVPFISLRQPRRLSRTHTHTRFLSLHCRPSGDAVSSARASTSIFYCCRVGCVTRRFGVHGRTLPREPCA